MTLLVDASVVISTIDRADRHHRSCLALLDASSDRLVPTACVAEIAWYCEEKLGRHVEVALAADLAEGRYRLEPIHDRDLVRIAGLCARYVDLPLGIADASIIAAAERLGLTTIATLDRRHFTVVRPRHCEAFTLVP